MKIGYARISRPEQKINLQVDALIKDGCLKIFEDVSTGSKQERKGLEDAIRYAREGDTIVVWKLDRLGRSIRNLIDMMRTFGQRNVGFKSLQENIDTSTSGGRLIFHMFSALAEFEYDLIKERSEAGVIAARARGRKGGRPFILKKKSDIQQMIEMSKDTRLTIPSICKIYGMHPVTFYRYVKRFKASEKTLQSSPQ